MSEMAWDATAHREEAAWSFTAFYTDHYRGVVKVLLAMTGNPSTAEDLAQEAFARAYRKWRQVSAYERPDAWVRTVAVNLARSGFRRRASEVKALARLALGRHPQAESTPVESEPFWSHVRSLPGVQPQVVVLRYVADLPIAEIAAVVGRPENTVKSDLHRARSQLARSLKAAEVTP